MPSRYEQGIEVLRKLMKRDVAPPAKAPEDPSNGADLGHIFVEHCYADSWARPGMDMKTKSLVTIAVLTTLGATNELKIHIRGAHNIGVTREDLVELFIHLAAYTGVPRTVNAREAAREVWRSLDTKKA